MIICIFTSMCLQSKIIIIIITNTTSILLVLLSFWLQYQAKQRERERKETALLWWNFPTGHYMPIVRGQHRTTDTRYAVSNYRAWQLLTRWKCHQTWNKGGWHNYFIFSKRWALDSIWWDYQFNFLFLSFCQHRFHAEFSRSQFWSFQEAKMHVLSSRSCCWLSCRLRCHCTVGFPQTIYTRYK